MSKERWRPDDPEQEQPKPKFQLGMLVATPAALEALEAADQTPLDFIVRHVTGDWGVLDEEDKALNERAVVEGYRIMSAYELQTGVKLWLITEWDRSRTTLLLPSDY